MIFLFNFHRRNPSPTNIGNYDFDDNNHGGEELDNSVQYGDENTQNRDNDFYDNYYIEDESPLTADKRGRHVVRSIYFHCCLAFTLERK